ncbi:MAG: OmpH family outer membrane protein [Syntrophaceae bacterium]
MKNRTLIILAFFLSILLGLSVPANAEEKIGFVNFQEVITTSNAGKAQADEFKKIMDKDRAALLEKETELKKMKEEIDKQRTTLKEAALKKKEAEFEKKLRDFQVAANDFNNDLRQREQEIFRKMIPEIMKIVKSMGEKGKYTMIVDPLVSQLPYHAADQDLTKKVIEEFNKATAKK